MRDKPMARRGAKTAKTKRRRKAPAPRRGAKPSVATAAKAGPQPPLDRLARELAQARSELAEAREQLAASSQVLGVIASSPGNARPIFQAILEKATRICQARFGTLNLYDDG